MDLREKEGLSYTDLELAPRRRRSIATGNRLLEDGALANDFSAAAAAAGERSAAVAIYSAAAVITRAELIARNAYHAVPELFFIFSFNFRSVTICSFLYVTNLFFS